MTPLAKAFRELLPIEETSQGFFTWLRGYFLRFEPVGNNATLVRVPLAIMTSNQKHSLVEHILLRKSDRLIKEMELRENELSYTFRRKTIGAKAQPQQIIDFLSDEAEWLREQAIQPGCAGCAVAGVHEVSRLHDYDLPLCESCHTDLRQTLRQRLSSDETGRNYLSGLVGAVIGSAVGAALFFVVAYFTQRLFSVLAIIIGLFAVGLYQKLKGKLTVAGGIMVGLVTTLVAVTAYFMYLYVLLRGIYDITPMTFVRNLDAVFVIPGVVSDLLFYLLFVLLSVFIRMNGFIKDVKRRQVTMAELGIRSKNDVI